MTETKTPQMKDMKKETPLKVSDIDPKFKNEVAKLAGAERVMLCYQCGTCTADCPIARFSDLYRPRRIIRMTQLGLKNKLMSNEAIWLCSTCFTCIDHCPQDVGIADIVRALRNLSLNEVEMPLGYKELALNILKTGYAYVIPERRLKTREVEGLPILPKTNQENLSKIFKITGLSKMLERGGS